MKVISARQEVRASLDRIAFDLQSSTPEEMATLLKDQLEVWRRTVQEVGLSVIDGLCAGNFAWPADASGGIALTIIEYAQASWTTLLRKVHRALHLGYLGGSD